MKSFYLPSKKIWLLIGAIAVISVVVYLLVGDKVNTAALISQNRDSEELETLDTDNDGLEDWEEALWNTDPENPDTDGDGVSDGEEVEGGTHPKIARPNDQLDQRRIDAVYSQDAEVPENKTREAWQELLPYMAAYVSVDDEGKQISAKGIEEISTEVAQRVEKESNQASRYELEDLSVETEPVFEDLDAYFLNLTKTTARYYSDTEMEDELLIFAQATAGDTIDTEQLVGLEVVATDYRSLTRELATITVPETLSTTHLNLLNNYLDLAEATENMAAIEEDPVRAMVGLKNYRELISRQQRITTDLGEQIGQETRRLLESSQQ